MSPALVREFLSTGPPEKSQLFLFLIWLLKIFKFHLGLLRLLLWVIFVLFVYLFDFPCICQSLILCQCSRCLLKWAFTCDTLCLHLPGEHVQESLTGSCVSFWGPPSLMAWEVPLLFCCAEATSSHLVFFLPGSFLCFTLFRTLPQFPKKKRVGG